MPGMDGLELCRWIRARSELPVILLTARGEEADRIVALLEKASPNSYTVTTIKTKLDAMRVALKSA